VSALQVLAEDPSASSAWAMVLGGNLSTQAILGILAVFSIASWSLILWKAVAFSRAWKQASRFMNHLESARGLEDSYRRILALPESPFTRVFRRGVTFFSELRPGGLREGAAPTGLSSAQLEVLRMVLEKEEAAERDELAHGLQWLAIIATVSPLLGLMGTVLGVMNSFVGVAAVGSASIAAVAPGVAEALTTTVAGLAVAIPAAIAYNYLAGKQALFLAELEGFSSEFIGMLAREGRI
jgi:biopolymer transport protein TolQ